MNTFEYINQGGAVHLRLGHWTFRASSATAKRWIQTLRGPCKRGEELRMWCLGETKHQTDRVFVRVRIEGDQLLVKVSFSARLRADGAVLDSYAIPVPEGL